MSSEQNNTRLSERAGTRHVARQVRARYDAAQTTDDNRRHWLGADGFSPDAAASPEIRRILMNRARYEFTNGSHCKGIVETLANDCVGSGPELQMLLEDRALASQIETDFWDWSEEIGFAHTLWQFRSARAHSGEGIGVISYNPKLLSEVKLDIRLCEPEQLTDVLMPSFRTDSTDGIEFDRYGNPVNYKILKYHPGTTSAFALYQPTDFDTIPARYVLHYFKADRPGQRRGVPDITPALSHFADLRRYTAAVIAAAEAVADHAIVIQSDTAPEDAEAPEPMDTIELEKRMATVLPPGYKLGQAKAEQPTTGYSEFVDAKIAEIARCLNMPFTIAAMSSAKANMSAAYLDGQRYANSVTIDRVRLERAVMNRVLDEFITEWARARRVSLPDRLPRTWRWPSLNHHADPAKVANAQTARLSNGTSSIPREHSLQGTDWEADQKLAAESLGITVIEYRELLRRKLFSNGNAPAEPSKEPTDENE